MSYTAPTTEQLFALTHSAGIAELSKAELFADATPDLIEAILSGVGAFAEGEWSPLMRDGDTTPASWKDGDVTMPPGFVEAYTRYVEDGWGTLSSSAEYGGQGLPLCLAIAALESLGSANLALALCPILTLGAIDAIEAHASDELKAAYLPKLVSAEWTGTMNLTEPQAGSDVGALKTSAIPNSDGSWSISGTKIFISFGEHDLSENVIHLVLARTPESPEGTKGISLFLVPKVLPDGSKNDLRCVSTEHKMGIHASPTCVMSFGDEGGATGWLIGEENAGMRAMFTMMNNARLNVAMQGVQVAERATQEALGYAAERVQTKPIIEHADVRRMLMRMKALTQGARALGYYAVGNVDRAALGDRQSSDRADLLTPLAKTWCTDIGCEVSSLCIQVFGGMGYVEETGVAQLYRDARIAPIYEGTNGIQAADFVGRKLSYDGGERFDALFGDIRAQAQHENLVSLVENAIECANWAIAANPQDRAAASYAITTMAAVAVAGWQLEKQRLAAKELLRSGSADEAFLKSKAATAAFFLDHIVAEANGLARSVLAGSENLYSLSNEELAA